MGTRHLIAVQKDGEYKVAQYGQWDGFPDSQGVDILSFLKEDSKVEMLKINLSKCRFLDYEGADKEFIEEYDKNTPKYTSDPDNRTKDQKEWFGNFISRDLGADVLKNIAYSDKEEIILKNSINFAGDSLFCEYAYVIDFDRNTFEVFFGFNKSNLSTEDRFYSIPKDKEGGEYCQVKLAKVYELSNLPSEESFLSDLQQDDEED